MSKTTKNGRATKRATGAVKRAAIYKRVSTEAQAKTKGGDGQEAEEKESPQAQERDCRALAERQGYVVVKVYRDTEKYRVGKKMVEPSGTRADRPGLRAMLADARKGDFDVILAWREDRLYRSYRPMLDVLDCLEETGVTIELALEHFDQTIAPVKAWAARMELEAKHDRTGMGIKGRLAQGKSKSLAPYGYTVNGDRYVADEDEAQWVRLIWQWFGDDVSMYEVRRRLIASGAKQREGGKSPWAIAWLRRVIHHDYYHTGLFLVTWAGEPFTLPVPVIVDAETAAHVKARRERWKAYPAGNLKVPALVSGVVYCEACNCKMSVSSHHVGGKYYHYYRCLNCIRRNVVVGCAKSVGLDRIDAEAWEKLWTKISVPGELEKAIQERVTELRAQEFDAEGECAKLQKKLDDLALKRQEAIVWAQDKIITQADLELRLTSLSFEQVEAERELRDKSLLVGNRGERLLAVATAYREAVVGGAVDLTQEPETPAEAVRVWQFKKTMVEGLVERVDVLPDKSTKVTFTLDFSKVAEDLCISDTPAASR